MVAVRIFIRNTIITLWSNIPKPTHINTAVLATVDGFPH